MRQLSLFRNFCLASLALSALSACASISRGPASVERSFFFVTCSSERLRVNENQILLANGSLFSGDQPAREGQIILNKSTQKIDKVARDCKVDPSDLEKVPIGIEVFDLTGKYVMPGLIDAGSYVFGDHLAHDADPEARKRNSEYVDVEYLGNRMLKVGVTSVHSLNGPSTDTQFPEYPRGIFTNRALQRDLSIPSRPRVFAAGNIFVNRPGYLSQNVLENGKRDPREAVASYIAKYKPDSISFVHRNFPEDSNFRMTDENIAAVLLEAEKAGIPSFAVITHWRDVLDVLKVTPRGPSFVVYPPRKIKFNEKDADRDEALKLLKAKKVGLLTLMNFQMNFKPLQDRGAELKEDPLYHSTVPERFLDLMAKRVYADNPRTRLSQELNQSEEYLEGVRMFHQQKLPILVGAGAGFIGAYFGPSMIEEMRLMQKALVAKSMSDKEAEAIRRSILSSATVHVGAIFSNAPLRVGALREGYAADLLVLNESPEVDIENLQRIRRLFLGAREIDLSSLPIEP